MPNRPYDPAQLNDLVLQMMETELGGEQVYLTALQCAQNPDLKEEWEEYLEETLSHQEVVKTLCEGLGLEPNMQTPSRKVVKHLGDSLVQAMQLALQGGSPAAAELVACECVVLAETKDHSNWELLGKVAQVATGNVGKLLKQAHERVETRRPPPLPHQGLVPRAVDPEPGHAGRVAATRRGQAGRKRHWRLARRAAARKPAVSRPDISHCTGLLPVPSITCMAVSRDAARRASGKPASAGSAR